MLSAPGAVYENICMESNVHVPFERVHHCVERSARIPVAARYFEAVIFTLACVSITTVFVINIHHRGSHHPRPPRLVRMLILDFLARLLCLHGVVQRHTKTRRNSLNKVRHRHAI